MKVGDLVKDSWCPYIYQITAIPSSEAARAKIVLYSKALRATNLGVGKGRLYPLSRFRPLSYDDLLYFRKRAQEEIDTTEKALERLNVWISQPEEFGVIT